MCLEKNGRVPQIILLTALFAIAISEAAINTDATGYSTTSRTTYMKDNAQILQLLDGIEDEGFYRVEKVRRRTKNDGAWLNYRSASEFSSTTLKSISDFYDDYGMQSSTNSFSFYGHTPLVGAMLDVKYEISADPIDDRLKVQAGEADGMYLYENRYVLPLGYMVSEKVLENVYVDSTNPFSVQNSFAAAACKVNQLYEINPSAKGDTVSVTFRKDGRGFIFINDKLSGARIRIMRGSQEIYNEEHTSLENPQIIDIGDVEAGDRAEITSTDDDVSTIRVYSAVMSYSKFETVMKTLSENVWEISEFSDTLVRGRINVEPGKVMLTSIPYYKGWDVYIDGKKAEYQAFDEAFIAVRLTSGMHEVEFRYHSPCLGAAVLISIVSILIFVCLCILRSRRPVKKN